ncbi:MAG TPA: sigma-70 family RNA polymerase sigma factor [Burkholderiaceae bacterium]|nr:sigma-70 family RNA polymerase sigma factor [Burkholderiaceae bacterium]
MDDLAGFDYEAALAACAAGDADALRRLYEHEGPRMLGVVRRIVRNQALAEDIVHDACINIWTRAASFDATRGSARGWIFSVTRHLALNAIRDNHEIAVDDETAAVLDAEAALVAWQASADALAWRTGTGRMAHCLEQLEPVRRSCVLHAYVEGLTHSEIARRIGTPLGTVKAWIRRSLDALRECLT